MDMHAVGGLDGRRTFSVRRDKDTLRLLRCDEAIQVGIDSVCDSLGLVL